MAYIVHALNAEVWDVLHALHKLLTCELVFPPRQQAVFLSVDKQGRRRDVLVASDRFINLK